MMCSTRAIVVAVAVAVSLAAVQAEQKMTEGDLDAVGKGEMISAAGKAVNGSLTITVVPDSATGELVGLTGKLDIIIEGKVHKYVLEYSMTKE